MLVTTVNDEAQSDIKFSISSRTL